MNELAAPSRRFLVSWLRSARQLLLACCCWATWSCSDDVAGDDTDETKRPTDVEPTDDAEPADTELEGVWLERGYARLFHISDEVAIEYHVTSVSCTPAAEYSTSDLLSQHDRIEVEDRSASWYVRDGFTRHDFDQLDALPTICTDPAEPTPQHVYDAFWHLFDENYAFLELRGVDWNEIRATHSVGLNERTTDEELMLVLAESIEPLNDGHVFVFDGMSQGFMSGSLGDLWERWAAQYEGEPVTNPIDPRGDFALDMQIHVAEDILDGKGKSAIHGLLNWGWLEDGIGYLALSAFYHPFEEEPSVQEIREMVDEAMLEVTTDLANAAALVVDVRFNQGGSDDMGYAIVSWLTDEPVLVSRKHAIYDGGWTPLRDVYVEPRGTVFFDKPVALLQSENTISAAETFAMAMNELPRVTSVGTRSYGVLSDTLVRVLPNGWVAALSNEIYEAPDGSIYEAVGVPVDVEVPYDVTLPYYENLDATLRRAVAELRAQVGR